MTKLFCALTAGRVLRAWALLGAASLLALLACDLLPAWQAASDPRTPADEAAEAASRRLRDALRGFTEARRGEAGPVVAADGDWNPLEAAAGAAAKAGASWKLVEPAAPLGIRLRRARVSVQGSFAAIAKALEAIEGGGAVRIAGLSVHPVRPGPGLEAGFELLWLASPEARP